MIAFGIKNDILYCLGMTLERTFVFSGLIIPYFDGGVFGSGSEDLIDRVKGNAGDRATMRHQTEFGWCPRNPIGFA